MSGFHPPEPPHPVSRRALPQLLLLLVVTSVVLSSLALAGVLPAARMATAAALEVSGDAHPLGRLLAPPPARSVIRAADGSVLAVLHGDQDRVVVPLSAVPMTVRDAVLAIEDARFYAHGALDLRGIARAAVADVTTRLDLVRPLLTVGTGRVLVATGTMTGLLDAAPGRWEFVFAGTTTVTVTLQ